MNKKDLENFIVSTFESRKINNCKDHSIIDSALRFPRGILIGFTCLSYEKLIDFGKEEEVPFATLMDELLEFIDDVVDELDCRSEVDYVHRILENGSGADRQLAVFKETNDLKKVMEYIISQTSKGL